MIGVYIAALAVVSVIAVSMVPKSNQEIDLHPEEA